MNLIPTDYSHQINLLHSFVVGPLLTYTGYKLNTQKPISNIEKTILLITGIVVIGYHGYRALNKQQEGASITQDYNFQVNLLHLFFIGPLVAWTGYKLTKGKKVTDLEKTTLLFLGISALVYHGYRAFQKFRSESSGIDESSE